MAEHRLAEHPLGGRGVDRRHVAGASGVDQARDTSKNGRRGTDKEKGGISVLSDFKKFILRGNVVDLAVAVVVGTAFAAVVAAFVNDLLTPLVAAIFGKQDFAKLYFTFHNSQFKYGSFINALLAFLIVATVVFFAVVVPLTALMRRLNVLPKEEAEPEKRPCPQCLSDIPVEAQRCAFCTSEVGAAA